MRKKQYCPGKRAGEGAVMITVILKKYNSKAFPVMAEWKEEGRKYSDVYDSKERAVDYLTGRFGKVKFIDRLPEGE